MLLERNRIRQYSQHLLLYVCVHIPDLQYTAQGVAGFSLEDLNSLCQVFYARKFDRNTKLVEAGSAASFFFMMLSGSAQV